MRFRTSAFTLGWPDSARDAVDGETPQRLAMVRIVIFGPGCNASNFEKATLLNKHHLFRLFPLVLPALVDPENRRQCSAPAKPERSFFYCVALGLSSRRRQSVLQPP